MKMLKLNYLLVIVMALTFAATGCKKKTSYLTPIPGSRSGAPTTEGTSLPPGPVYSPDDGVGSGDSFGSLSDLESFEGMAMDRTALAAETVYFDFDSSAIKSSQKSKIQNVAGVLKGDPSLKVLVEGHCDERGTEEYNRSLGERRALAVREALAKEGIDPSRVRTLTFGEDRPADPGHGEAAWAKNRRAEFVLLRPKY
ncbi:MAG TPA: OmpA family protein [Verrucomicrobiota bacterium]|nr:OmpA family protein [Verrucomicrobiota bacterium]